MSLAINIVVPASGIHTYFPVLINNKYNKPYNSYILKILEKSDFELRSCTKNTKLKSDQKINSYFDLYQINNCFDLNNKKIIISELIINYQKLITENTLHYFELKIIDLFYLYYRTSDYFYKTLALILLGPIWIVILIFNCINSNKCHKNNLILIISAITTLIFIWLFSPGNDLRYTMPIYLLSLGGLLNLAYEKFYAPKILI